MNVPYILKRKMLIKSTTIITCTRQIEAEDKTIEVISPLIPFTAQTFVFPSLGKKTKSFRNCILPCFVGLSLHTAKKVFFIEWYTVCKRLWPLS